MTDDYDEETLDDLQLSTRGWQVWAFLLLAWAFMPLMTVWLMLTHPGKCALIWKRELTGTWFTK